MSDSFDIRNSELYADEKEFDVAVRPGSFIEFKGQDRIVNNLKILNSNTWIFRI